MPPCSPGSESRDTADVSAGLLNPIPIAIVPQTANRIGTLYAVGTTDTKYWNLWKWPGAALTVWSSGLVSEGRNGPNENSEMTCEKLKAAASSVSH